MKDPNVRAYNRTAFLAQRQEMMQTWANYLEGLKSGAKVIPFKKAESEYGGKVHLQGKLVVLSYISRITIKCKGGRDE
jgi:hypothetical protein